MEFFTNISKNEISEYTYDDDEDYLNNIQSSDFSNRNYQRGGFFWSCDDNEDEKTVLDLAREKNYDAIEVFMNNKKIDNLGYQDESGSTILHYIARDIGKFDISKDLLNKILDSPDIKSVVNKQDENGNTPLHIAAKNLNHDFAEILEAKGADKEIKNKKGESVETETIESPSSAILLDRVTKTFLEEPKLSPTFSMINDNETEMRENVDDIIEKFFGKKLESEDDLSTLNYNSQNYTDNGTDDIFGFAILTKNKDGNNNRNKNLTNLSDDTESFLQKMLNDMKSNKGMLSEDSPKTEKFVDQLMGNYQAGGARGNIITGRRKLHTYVEGNAPGSDLSSSVQMSDPMQNELKKIINGQVNVINKRITDTIKDLKGISSKQADEIKSQIEKRMSRSFDTPLERAANLEKMIKSKPEILDTLEVAHSDTSELVSNMSSDVSDSTSNVLNRAYTDISDTSDALVPSGENYSATSFSEDLSETSDDYLMKGGEYPMFNELSEDLFSLSSIVV